MIDGRFAGQTITGVQRYATEVVRGFDRLLAEDSASRRRYDLVLAVPPGTSVSFNLDHVQVQPVGHLTGHLWQQLELDRFSGRDLLLCLCNVGPLRRRNQIVTLHDASVFAHPAAYSRMFRTWYGMVQQQIGARALMVLTDSEFSRNELHRYLDIPLGRIRVVPLGGNHLESVVADRSILVRHGLGRRRFVLAVSSLAPHKNFGVFLDAIAQIHEDQPDLDIVVAGGRFERVFNSGRIPIPDAIQVGYVTDAELKALYQSAACFVYPSLYEGFGLPPLEAMACGCPVVLSSAASLPEVGKGAVLYFEPTNPASLAHAVSRVLNEPALAGLLQEQGRLRAAELTWDRCARQTFALVEQSLAS
ncbi:MAG TPA: glycosyltransferase family 1 protein [Gemmatimonadales bacterium]|nr:glycosyltransferase family 1 protein [Gemmatimonadales bacterium]